MNINIDNSNGVTTANLEGRLDTPASTEVAPCFEQLKEAAGGTVVLDCSKLSYISLLYPPLVMAHCIEVI